ncbi:hypothetical protein WG66_003319 [Moniliophthora roreri]|nr:hypothetical protein WG66_003319 [Moniliophthora roreri]
MAALSKFKMNVLQENLLKYLAPKSPYIRSVIEADPNLDNNQMAILYLDCYPVHTSKEFQEYVAKDHPNVQLIYVPANCTSIFQPADVGLQCPIKHLLKQCLFEWMAEECAKQLAAGTSPEDV